MHIMEYIKIYKATFDSKILQTKIYRLTEG